MKTKNIYKEKCNIFIPRNINSILLILAKKKNYKEDNYILINNNRNYSHGFSNDIIDFLKKEKFKIIFKNKDYTFKGLKNSQSSFMQKYLKVNFFKNLDHISNSILKTKYEEFNDINFNNYKFVNIYYGSNIIYYSKLCKKFKHINLFFLEHGVGNFLSFVKSEDNYHHSLKRKMISFLEILFFKIKGISLINRSYYYGIYGKIFNKKNLNYDNHKTKFINLNYKNGFNLLYKFYKKNLTNLKKNKKKNYIFLDIPFIYELKLYKKFLRLMFKNIKYKRNYVLLIKLHPNSNIENNYIVSLKKLLKDNKINYLFLNSMYNHIPAEIILKFFKVREIYAPQTSILFTSSYFLGNKIKINILYSSNIKKKYEKFMELKPYTLNFIKENYIYKNQNIICIN